MVESCFNEASCSSSKEAPLAKVFVKDVHDKERVKSVFQVVRKAPMTAKNGKPYLAVALRDKSGELDARVWEHLDQLEPKLVKGELAQVEGLVTIFQGRLQMRIDAVDKPPTEGLDPADFIPPPRNTAEERSFLQICELVDRIQDAHLRALLHSFLDDEAFASEFKRAPAAKTIHHAHLGGLCEHTLSTMRLALRIAEHYPMVDRDLMTAGAFLHDLGKLRELRWGDRQTEYTDEGRMIGHPVIAAQLVHDHASKIDGFPKQLEMHLTHLVLAHHGSLEFASPRVPVTLEAMLLHYADEIDSRINGWLEVMKRDVGEQWTSYQELYDRHLYKGVPPTSHGRAPVERRQRPDREHERRRIRMERAAPAETGAAAPSKGEAAAKPSEALPPATEAKPQRERRERPPKKSPEEKLTFKPFAALVTSEAAPAQQSEAAGSTAESAPAQQSEVAAPTAESATSQETAPAEEAAPPPPPESQEEKTTTSA
jgi:3'-5' exoribonuclease